MKTSGDLVYTKDCVGAQQCGTYRPLAPIHRDAMAAFIYRYKH